MGKRARARPPLPPPGAGGDDISAACGALIAFMGKLGAEQVSLLLKSANGDVLAAFYCVTDPVRAKKLAAAMDGLDE